MRKRIEKTLADFLKDPTVLPEKLKAAYNNGVSIPKKLKKYGEALENRKNFVIKHFDLPELHNIEPSGRCKKINNIKLSLVELQKQPCFYDQTDIQRSKITSDGKLIKFAMTLLVYNLLNNHNLFDNQITCANFIFDKFADTEFHNQYDEIRNSEFMKAMRKQYMEDDKLKENLTYSQVMKEIFFPKKEKVFNTQEIITDLDKIHYYCTYIYKHFNSTYRSPLEIKQAHNTKIIETEQHNMRVKAVKIANADEKWTQFSTQYIAKLSLN